MTSPVSPQVSSRDRVNATISQTMPNIPFLVIFVIPPHQCKGSVSDPDYSSGPSLQPHSNMIACQPALAISQISQVMYQAIVQKLIPR